MSERNNILKNDVTIVGTGRGMIRPEFAREAAEQTGLQKPRVLLVPTSIHKKNGPVGYEGFVKEADEVFGGMGLETELLHEYGQMPGAEAKDKIDNADVIWVGWDNTEMMIHLWGQFGRKDDSDTNLRQKITAAGLRGAVLAGGSAGMLAWYTAGYSDSDKYTHYDPSQPTDGWDLKAVRGTGLINAFGNPHHDRPSGNSPLSRREKFEQYYTQSGNEWLPDIGIGVPNDGALVLRGDNGAQSFKFMSANKADTMTLYHRSPSLTDRGRMALQSIAVESMSDFRPAVGLMPDRFF